MKFKVGQMVRAKGDRWFNKGELLKIVELDRSDRTYRCKGTDETLWQPECNLEPLVSSQEKLDRFLKEPVGFLVKSKEIADGLTKVFERKHMKARDAEVTPAEVMDTIWKRVWNVFFVTPYVTYNYHDGEHKLSGGRPAKCKEKLEFLDVTLDEIKKYLESTEDFKGNKQEEHMKITIETDGHHKTTAECNGITAESLCNPMDDFKLPKGVHMAVQRLLEKLERPDEDTCFHVGDTVEVVGCHNKFLRDVVGKRGVVIRIDEHASEKYEIKYEENVSGDNRWWSHPEELKLISKEDTKFHVGDIVEVVDADGYEFFDKVKGIQGVIVSYYDKYVCEVKFPFVVSKKDTWCYHTRALKLIRRGNN